MQKLATPFLLCALLGACAHVRNEQRVNIGDALAFDFLPPASFGKQLILTQAASLRYGDETHDLLFYTEITAKHVSIAGLLPNGIRLFSISYDGESIDSKGSADVLKRLDPGYLLADLQIALWPLSEVRKSFEQANACFNEGECVLAETADQSQRNLSRGRQPLIDIHYEGVPHYQSILRYQHLGRNYQLLVETLDIQFLEQAAP